MRTARRWSFVLALACFSSALPLQANQLKVGISGSAPFVIKDGDATSGISLETVSYTHLTLPTKSSV